MGMRTIIPEETYSFEIFRGGGEEGPDPLSPSESTLVRMTIHAICTTLSMAGPMAVS